MKTDMSDTIGKIGRKGELELEKLFCVLLSLKEQMKERSAEDPTYEKSLDYERAQFFANRYRAYISDGKDLFDQLVGWIHRLEFRSEKAAPDVKEDVEEEYPLDPLYHMAVAEQEEDLQRMYPSRFGNE